VGTRAFASPSRGSGLSPDGEEAVGGLSQPGDRDGGRVGGTDERLGGEVRVGVVDGVVDEGGEVNDAGVQSEYTQSGIPTPVGVGTGLGAREHAPKQLPPGLITASGSADRGCETRTTGTPGVFDPAFSSPLPAAAAIVRIASKPIDMNGHSRRGFLFICPISNYDAQAGPMVSPQPPNTYPNRTEEHA
jgi:hypothetical protein